MKKITFALLLLSYFFVYSKPVDANKFVPQTGSIVGVVVAQENGTDDDLDYTVGISFNYTQDSIDRFQFKLPFKYKPEVGFSDPNWTPSIKGRTVTLTRKDDVPANDRDNSINTANFRLDISDDDSVVVIPSKITGSSIWYKAFADNKKVHEEKFQIKLLPRWGLDNVIFVPGQVSPGQKFTATINDDGEQAIQAAIYRKSFGDLNLFPQNEQKFNVFTRLRGQIQAGEVNGEPVVKEPFSYRTRLNFDTSFTGEDRLRIRYDSEVPEKFDPKQKLGYSYTNRFGLTQHLPTGIFVTPLFDDGCELKIKDCSRYGFANQTICACGCFDTDYSDDRGFTLNGFTIDGKDTAPLALSPTTASIFLPEALTPGEHVLRYQPRKGPASTIKFIVLKVNGSIDQNKLWTGQSTKMRLAILGTGDKLPIEIWNRTPKVISLEGGNKQVVDTSGGSANVINKGVKGTRRGNFRIDYKLSLPACPCNAPE